MARARVPLEPRPRHLGGPRRASGAGRAALDVLVNHSRDGLLRGRAHHALLLLAVLEEDERRDALDAVALRDLRVVVNVELDDRCAFGVLLRDGLDRRREHAAGRAPLRPEVHEHRTLGLENVRLETLVTHFLDLFTHAVKSPSIALMTGAERSSQIFDSYL